MIIPKSPNLKRKKLHLPPEYKIGIMCEESLKTKVYKWNGTTLSQLTSKDITVFNHGYKAKGLINNNNNIIARYSDGQWLLLVYGLAIRVISFNELVSELGVRIVGEYSIKLYTAVANTHADLAPNERYIAFPACDPERLVLLQWNGENFSELDTVYPSHIATRCFFSKDSKYVIVHTKDPYILVYKIENDKLNLINTYDSPTGWAPCAGCFSPDGNYYVCAFVRGDSYIYQFDNGELTPLATIDASNTYMSYRVRFSPDGQYIAFLNYNHYLLIYHWDGTNATHLITYGTPTAAAGVAIEWSPDGQYILYPPTSYFEVLKWDGSSLTKTSESPNLYPIIGLSFTKDDNYIHCSAGASNIFKFSNGQVSLLYGPFMIGGQYPEKHNDWFFNNL